MSEVEDASNELAEAIHAGLVVSTPIFDAADGIRKDLERRGWSPTAAEVVALEWLQNTLRRMWSSS